MTPYQALVACASVDEPDAKLITRHLATCFPCAGVRCEPFFTPILLRHDHNHGGATHRPLCRVTNCRTLDAMIEMFVEARFPKERPAYKIKSDQFERDAKFFRSLKKDDE